MTAATVARVLFDEAHSEAWTIRPELASEMQPAHPGDASYAVAAQALAARDFVVSANVETPLSERTLESCDVLVIAHPSDPAWERTTGTGSPPRRSLSFKSRPSMMGTPSAPKNPGETARNCASGSSS